MIASGISRPLAFIWALAVLSMLALLVVRGLSLQTNMLMLLPEARRDALTLQAVRQHGQSFINNVVFLVGADNLENSQTLAETLAEKLRASGLFGKIHARFGETDGLAFYRFYQPHSTVLLSDEDAALLRTKRYVQLQQRILMDLAAPTTASGMMLENDPAMFFTNFISALKPYSGAFKLQHGMLSTQHASEVYTLVNAQLSIDPFALSTQQAFSELYQRLRSELEADAPQAVLLSAGMIRNVAAGTRQATHEISTIGSGSLLGLLLLFALAFASLRPLLYALLPISAGVIAALAVCSLVFDAIHIITLVFGASLIGVSIDYALHFFAEQSNAQHQDTAAQSLKRILPGITLGLTTSLIGYAAFFIAPFPGLQQMALFSSTGLLAAYCSVLLWFPHLSSPVRKGVRSVTLRLANRMLQLWAWQQRRSLPLIPLLFVVSAIIGVNFTHSNDDIRLLDNTPPDLQVERQSIERISALRPASQFFLVRGMDAEQVLQREERLIQHLNGAIEAGQLTAFRALSTVLPSQQMQIDHYRLIRDALYVEQDLNVLLKGIGFQENLVERYRQRYAQPEPSLLTWEQGLASPLYNSLQWLESDNDEYGTLVYVYGAQQIDHLREIADRQTGVQWVDQVADITAIFSEYRQHANYLVAAAYLCIFFLLLWRYGLKGAARVILPPLLAAAFALAVTGYTGQPLTLFNTLALLLVLGIGIDYTLFFAESKGTVIPTMHGVLLSAFTTLLSFGLLALSSTPAIRSIGLTVLCGITAALFLSPLAIKGHVLTTED